MDFSLDEEVVGTFNLFVSAERLGEMLKRLPAGKEVYKLISPIGGYSSCSLLMWIAEKTRIQDIIITTLRVGKKELNHLVNIKNDHGASVKIVLSDLSRENKANGTGKTYDYTTYFEGVCNDEGIEYYYAKNHAKLILIKSETGTYTVETSSNFNENPKIEQFSISASESVYEYYRGALKKMGVYNGKTKRKTADND